MANLNIKLSEEEVQNIIIETVRKKFNLEGKTQLTIKWDDDSGATVSTPETNLDKTSWLED